MCKKHRPLSAIHDQLSDEQLVRRYNSSGDMSFIGILYKRYAHLLLGLAFKYTKNQVLAEDAVMEIFEHMLEKLPHQSISHFRSWIYTLAKNILLRDAEKRERQPIQVVSFDENEKSEEENVENEEKMYPYIIEEDVLPEIELKEEKVRQALNMLKDDQKEVIRLFYFEGLSYKQISETTGLEVNMVKAKIQNGKLKLQKLLEDLN